MLLGACGQPALVGTDLGEAPAADFQLVDQDGQTVRLQDLRGKAVALTFLYTHCPDVCPVITAKFREVSRSLDDEPTDVALVAVTVDPERDTVERLREYTASVGMDGRWHFLTGERSVLEHVWSSYGIGVTHSAHDHMIGHTDAVYLIDPEGRQRLLMRQDLDPADLARNLRTLAQGA
jgi:protein SCO1/2